MNVTYTDSTKILGRVGVKASQSGKTIYNPLFEHMNLDAIYLQFVIPEDKTKEYLESVKTLNILGSGVTGPHTHNLMELVDEIDESAKVTNHGNCLVNRNGKTILFSTDVAGMMNTLLPLEGTLENKSITILGGGHLMPGILNELQKHKVKEIVVYNRTVDKLTQLKKDFNIIIGGNIDTLVKEGKGDIFINSSDVGANWCDTKDDLLTDEFLLRFKTAMDVTFMPFASNWSLRAQKLGLKVGFGYEMFAHQGAQQLRNILQIEPDMSFLIPLVKKGLGG